MLTALQWYNVAKKDARPKPDLNSHPSQRNHRFFDSKGPGGVITPRPSTSTLHAHGGQDLEIDKDHIIQYAHFGYVYCMLLARDRSGHDWNEETLISGGGDGVINLWTLDRKLGGILRKPFSLENGDESILTLALDGTLLYSGRLDGDVNVWDLDTRQLIRRVKAHTADILALTVGHGFIFAGGANGFAKVSEPPISFCSTVDDGKRFNSRYECTSRWKAHDQLILASAIATHKEKAIYVTGGNDDCVAIWDVDGCVRDAQKPSMTSNGSQ